MILLSDSLKEYSGISKCESNLESIEDETIECSKSNYEKASISVTYSIRDYDILYKDIIIKGQSFVYLFTTDRETRKSRKSVINTLVYKLGHVYKIEESIVNKFKVLGKEKDLEDLETIKKLVENNQLTVVF